MFKGDSQMKKIDMKFILIYGAILLALSFIIGAIIGAAIGGDTPLIQGALNMTPFLFFLLLLVSCFLGNSFIGGIAKKTSKNGAEKEGMNNYSTFVNEGSFTLGSIICIDESTGKIGYVSYLNPKEFQVLSADAITDIKSSYVKGPLGGTSYVYFEFYYNKKKVRIPTFTSNNTYSLESTEVLEGISKADTFAEILTNTHDQATRS